MTTTELIALLKEHEFGGATGRAREVSIQVGENIYETDIASVTTGDGLITELTLELSAQPERKTGKWIQNDNGTWSCDQCHSWIPDEQHYYANFCLYCGARMEA